MCDQKSLKSACAYAQSDQSLCLSIKYAMTVKLLTKHHLEFLSLKGGCTGSSESTFVKMPHCWKSHIVAHIERCGNTMSGLVSIVNRAGLSIQANLDDSGGMDLSQVVLHFAKPYFSYTVSGNFLIQF